MSYRLLMNKNNYKNVESHPTCIECGREYRYGYRKGYYGSEKVFCICERGLFDIGGIRTKNSEKVPADLISSAIKTMESYGFIGVSVRSVKEKDNAPSGYSCIITAAYHTSPEVMAYMLNNKKGERTFAVTYTYGQAVVKHAPFDTYANGWDYVQKLQRSNRDLSYAVLRYLTKDLEHLSDVDDSGSEDANYTSEKARAIKLFHQTVWNVEIYTSEDVEWEQGRKAADELSSQKNAFRKKIQKFNFDIEERLRENERDQKHIEKLRAEFKQLYWEEA
jgi:hypothetical protein